MPNICKPWNNQELLKLSIQEYNKKCRRISIKNMPQGISNQDILDLLKPYYYQQIHIDKTSQSCKAVLLNGEAATRCINDLHLKPFKGTNLNVSLASCDFMLCITQLPLMYTLEQFQTLITPFGTAERCFLVHSEISGESKGYGCVEFTSKESSIKAKNQLNGRKIGVQVLQVHWLDSIPTEYSGLHSKCLYVENLPYNFKDNDALYKIFSQQALPQFCKLASSSKDDFAVVEFSDHLQAENCWKACDGLNIGGNAIRVSFCVPGPCGLVILNSLRASRDLKRNNPCGGLLPTPVPQVIDNSLNSALQQRFMQQKLKHKGLLHYDGKSNVPLAAVDGTLSNAASHTDPEVQRLLKALQVRLLHVPPDNDCHTMHNGLQPTHNPLNTLQASHSVNSLQQISASVEALHTHNTTVDTKNMSNLKTSNHLLPLRSHRGRSASYDSGVHTVDDDVFSSNNSSQEDVQQSSDQQQTEQFHPHLCPPFYPGQQYVGWNTDMTSIKRSWKSMQPLTYDSVLYCKREELQRSDSADSAYGGSQESASSLSDGYHYGNEWQPGVNKSKSFGGHYHKNALFNSQSNHHQANDKMENMQHMHHLSNNQYQNIVGYQTANNITAPTLYSQSNGLDQPNKLKHHPQSHFENYNRDSYQNDMDKNIGMPQKSSLPRPEFLEVTTNSSSRLNHADHLPIFTNSFLPSKFTNKLKTENKPEASAAISTPVRATTCSSSDFTTPRMVAAKSGFAYNLRDVGADSPTQLQLLGSSLMEGLFGESPRSANGSISLSSSLNATSCEPGRLIHALNLFSPTEYLTSPHTPLTFRKLSMENMLPSPEPSPEAGAYVGQHSQGLGGHYAELPILASLFGKRRKSNDT